ncbi:molybdopterin molybdotransferase MoeA [Brevibacillus agri]|uniref:molybdopterin molybdotransferase MoeA n=1 Tax=Brevibacillus TaxID=55080 RepID=UPI000271AA5C|nr:MULTISPECIES: gephyrin-like molybdotransferase Glp [Brevibacillus]EJL44247.1 molybdopterin biosynthesis enzyme [Brevibacillus sp. CF112]MBY0054579.1 molybdopterin molybdotransferase MoeA [Brevibacillus agri]MCG5253484.1 molybdopterin molybdotransferase MoeA [Brevibacillus agri]MED1643282.1 molybdopterin molybdotransferase MoeA [Brevibacillus agri]MED1656484.1 molybdopterin molybdotransferase MoeA [Brevibacillus agri]
MRFARQTVSVEEAMGKWLAALPTLETERVHIGEAYGRILACDLYATYDLPHFDRSPLDGFAVRAADTVGATIASPLALKVIETVAAGQVPERTVTEGCATRIMTGAMMPEGADAVIMFEQTQNPGEHAETVWIKRAMQPGENVSRRGEEMAKGTVIAKAGERINAGTIASLATFGYAQVDVFRRPRVGLLATGSELLGIDEPLVPGKIRNSNMVMLTALIAEAGGIPVCFSGLPDELAVAKQKISEYMQQVDVLVSSGGVSVGDFDVIALLTDEPDVELLFNRVAMRPASPTTSMLVGGKPYLALSGNPGACFLGFELFARTAIRRLSGAAEVVPHAIRARLAVSYQKPCPFPRYLRGRLLEQDGGLLAVPDFNEKAGNLGTLKDSECFIVIPPGGSGKQAGELVEVLSHAAPTWRKEG